MNINKNDKLDISLLIFIVKLYRNLASIRNSKPHGQQLAGKIQSSAINFFLKTISTQCAQPEDQGYRLYEKALYWCNETVYYLVFAHDTGYIEPLQFKKISESLETAKRLLLQAKYQYLTQKRS